MRVKSDNKGFSMVELIIVIAVIAVLVGVLSPQYLKYVNNARVNTDITNAVEMAKYINAAISDSYNAPIPNTITGVGGTTIANVDGLDYLPFCKYDSSFVWEISSTQGGGVSLITLNGYQIYPDTQAAGSYYDQYHID